MKKSHLSNSPTREDRTPANPSFGAHPMGSQSESPVQMRSMAPVGINENAAVQQQKEKVGPDAIPDSHVGFEYIAKLSYKDTAEIQSNPEIVQFLANFGYSAAAAQVIKGSNGFAMLYIPGSEDGGNPPIIAFRGTEPTELADLLADIDLSYIGEPQFTNNKEMIESTMEMAGGSVVLLGHSLGGALAQKASLEFTSLTKEVVTFQAPALGLAEQSNSEEREDLPISTHHLAEHDLVDRAGFYRTPGDIFIHDSSLGPLSAHTDPLFGTSQFAEEREALGIPTNKDEKGNEIDGILGHEIRQQDPEKNHIEKHDDYPGFRGLSGLSLEVIRSAFGLVKTGGEVIGGAGKLLGKGLKAIGDGLGGLFGGGKEDEDKKPATTGRR